MKKIIPKNTINYTNITPVWGYLLPFFAYIMAFLILPHSLVVLYVL